VGKGARYNERITMRPAKYTHPNADITQVLSMRINPDGRTFRLHPMDLDLERFLEQNGGRATVKLVFLLARNHASADEHSGRDYHEVND